MKTTELLAAGDRTGNPSYAPARMVIERADGMYVYDRDGKAYLDFLAGIAVNCLGNCAPAIVEAVQRQAATLLQISNMFYSDVQIRLQESLTGGCFADRVFLCNSGAEANEAAIKLARRYQRVVRGEPRTEIITFEKSFHGRTLAAITATGQPKYHKGFEPLVPGFRYARFGDIASVEALASADTVAVMVEPIQGEGGVRPAPDGFLSDLRDLCDRTGALLVFDEVQTGVGRSGNLYAYQHFGVTPDIMTLAKGLGGGVPIGATLATAKVFEGFTRGSHASTFGGNPLACAAAEVVLREVAKPEFLEQVRSVGAYLQGALRTLDGAVPIHAVRGVGLMVGAEVGAEKAGAVAAAARDHGLLINTAGGDTLRFVPPLIAGRADVDLAMERLRAAMKQVVTD
jgi:acetylornithine/N-succinyldiaminopimelate aminotransferase